MEEATTNNAENVNQNESVDISKDPQLIKEAQNDLAKFDVLVCGGCHEVFHVIEAFQQHKSSKECTNNSTVKCENDGKSQAWGFALWKAKQRRLLKENSENILTSWEFYQRWTKLEQTVKELWVEAGRNLQFCNKIASGRLANSNSLENNSAARENEADKPKSAVPSKDNDEGYIPMEILGKRYNPRKKQWEYEMKWDKYDQQTWEPQANLEIICKTMLREYEAKLKAEKEKEKEKTPATRGRGRPRLNPGASPAPKPTPKKAPPSPIILNTSGGRPQRQCKQKALSQVKAWCGNISDGEEGGVKRPYDDDDESDDSFEKKLKLGADSEDTEDDEPNRTPLKRVAKIIHTYNNGSNKIINKLPDNVLIPDAKGVVRISQKQLPSLSSGVYIMSKSSGIIKLDPTASKIATSGGQAIVKVSPKIGQTQIRIIKKADVTKGTLTQVKLADGTTAKLQPKIIQQTIKTPLKNNIEKLLKKIEASPKAKATKVIIKDSSDNSGTKGAKEDESDDGLEELEFPTDLPIPSPESPPREFILDPTTGKVVGQDYPEGELMNNNLKKDKNDSKTLENIVQLAAADITEEDLKPDDDETQQSQSQDNLVANSNNKGGEANTVKVTEQQTTSILNAAILNSNILQKTLQLPKKTQARIISSQTIVTTPSTVRNRQIGHAIIRTVPNSNKPGLVRPPKSVGEFPPKPKFNIQPTYQKANAPRNVYSKASANVRRIGNTYIAKTDSSGSPAARITQVKKPPTPQKQQIVHHVLQATTPTAATGPQAIISMPSLDEEAAATVVAQQQEANVTLATSTATPTVQTTDLSSFTLNNEDKPVFITADDGTVYQVAGQNEEGQTILLTQDSEGQQCLVITNDPIQGLTQEQSEATTEAAAAETAEPALVEKEDEKTEMQQEEQPVILEEHTVQSAVDPLEIATEEEPVVAQFIRTEPPSPGGTHKVVVMLPGGDVMVTQVTPEEYASLELDK